MSYKETEYHRVFISNKINEKILRRMVFLHNNLMQYFSHSYNEVILRWMDTGDEELYRESIIYFQPTKANGILQPKVALSKSIIENMITNNSVSKKELEYANEMWIWLRKKAKIDLSE